MIIIYLNVTKNVIIIMNSKLLKHLNKFLKIDYFLFLLRAVRNLKYILGEIKFWDLKRTIDGSNNNSLYQSKRNKPKNRFMFQV